MKIRWDFVTNSSSTSFVIICKGKPNQDIFLTAMGAQKGSPLRPLFTKLYEVLCEKMVNATDELHSQYSGSVNSILSLVEKKISKAAADQAKEALANGRNVWIGKLDSDAGDVETFFCCEPFEINHPKLRLNALRCVW
jgi:hypothetical protein